LKPIWYYFGIKIRNKLGDRMANITVKNIPDDLYENLKQYARINHRSINNEIIVCIEKAVKGQTTDKQSILERAQKLRVENNLPYLTEKELNHLKNEGRK
jgi:plasmid stability protein